MNTIECPHCHKFYKSYKSFHRHKTLKHYDKIVPLDEQSKIRQEQYNTSPKKCPQCNIVIPYESRRNTFCSHSCSQIFNENSKSEEQREHERQQKINLWRQKLGSLNRDDPFYKHKQNLKYYKSQKYIRQYPKSAICVTCSSKFESQNCRHKYCSPQCNTSRNSKALYRIACRFNLPPSQYPELFNQPLVEQYGWYNPTNKAGPTNLTGVCWDHLYRIEEGYKNNIPASIMSHPANAELVPWGVNKNRTSSMITYEQLLERIDQWEGGNRNLPTFL